MPGGFFARWRLGYLTDFLAEIGSVLVLVWRATYSIGMGTHNSPTISQSNPNDTCLHAEQMHSMSVVV